MNSGCKKKSQQRGAQWGQKEEKWNGGAFFHLLLFRIFLGQKYLSKLNVFISYNFFFHVVSHSCFFFSHLPDLLTLSKIPFSKATLLETEQVLPKSPKCSMNPCYLPILAPLKSKLSPHCSWSGEMQLIKPTRIKTEHLTDSPSLGPLR